MTRVSIAKVPYGGVLHRLVNKPPKGTGARIRLGADHPAIVGARTIFPSTVVHPDQSPRILIAGFNSRKIGAKVTKGRWKGMSIYTLTLEERATCPRTCGEFTTCYGNNMHLARRHAAGPALESRLVDELKALALRHPGGFVVRLHVLGDFYSVPYVALWCRALMALPGLRIFGFTAHDRASEIGRAITEVNFAFPDRCRIRTSGSNAGRFGSLVIDRAEDSKHVLCPVQTGQTDCCGTCGLCWTMTKTVEFVRH